jgi:transcriptional regulator with XRE-family HTH domain
LKPADFTRDDAKKQKFHPYDVIVGANLRRLRIGKGCSQDAVAAEVDLTAQQVSKMEFGENRIGAGRLAMLAEFLGCSILDFFDGVGNKKASQRILDSANSDMNCRVVHAFNALRPKQQAAVMNLMRTMAGGDID